MAPHVLSPSQRAWLFDEQPAPPEQQVVESGPSASSAALAPDDEQTTEPEETAEPEQMTEPEETSEPEQTATPPPAAEPAPRPSPWFVEPAELAAAAQAAGSPVALDAHADAPRLSLESQLQAAYGAAWPTIVAGRLRYHLQEAASRVAETLLQG